MTNIITKKPAWFLASVLSVIYAIIFVLVANGTLPTKLLFGFCVWGSYSGDGKEPHEEYPDKDNGCTNFDVNSHRVAFIIDVIMTLLAGLFYVMDKNADKKKLVYIAVAFIILGHGLLHWFLQQDTLSEFIMNCYTEVDKKQAELGSVLFTIFSFFLSLIILTFGFGIKLINFVFSVIFAGIVAQVANSSGGGDGDGDSGGVGELFLPALFVVVHPLSCITGLLSDDPSFNPTVAIWFVICTIIGIIELSACANILRPIGGHFWYDVTLHSAVLASLPYFDPPPAKGKQE